MDREYHFNRYARLRNMIIFAVIVSSIVFTLIYFLFLEKDVARIIARITGHYSPGMNVTINVSTECDDECLIKAAIANSDSSYCRNVSTAKSDECWQVFSNSDLSACLALRNYLLRKGCVMDFAVFGKNASLCDLLKAEDRTSCRERVNPPCLDIPEGEKRETCLALRYNDTKYCTLASCFLTYATMRNDTTACSGLFSDAENYACRSVVEKKNECSLLSGVYTVDYCYQLLAQYSGDYSYCGLVESGLYKFNCYLSAALAEKNYSHCANNELLYMWDCYRNYSLSSGDISGCNAISDKYVIGTRDGCLRAFALQYYDPSACNNLSTIYIRINCYADVILQTKNLSQEKCLAVANADWKDKCFSRFAAQKNDTAICSYIQNTDERRRCGG